MTKTLVVAVLTLVAMICFFPGNSRANSITVTVDEQQYDITTLTGTFTDNMALLESQPWWGNATLAQAIANAVADDIGTPNDSGTEGPLFAYDLDALDAFIWFQGSASSESPSESVSLAFGICSNAIGSNNNGACAGKAIGGNVPEPASVGMLFAGLFALGLCAGMKHRRRNGPAVEA